LTDPLGIGLRTKDFNMDEKARIRQGNEMRSQIITSQVAPALVLIAILVVAAYDKFDTASDSAKFLALGVAAVTGFLATISQYAAIREGEALLIDMGKVDKPSALANKIAESRGLLSLSAIAIIAFDVAMFALVTWAILG
jgi:aldehyde:ferredoxin oxidoreductase